VWGNKPTIPELNSWDRGQYAKLNCPTLLREELTRVAAEGQHSCCLVKTTALTTLHEQADLHHLPVATKTLWIEGNKYYSQASHLMRPHQSFHLYTNTRIGHLRKSPELLPKD
jgi:hypothetical protein